MESGLLLCQHANEVSKSRSLSSKTHALVSRGLLLNQPEIQDLVFSQPIRFNMSAGNPLDSLENADLEITVLTTTKPWL